MRTAIVWSALLAACAGPTRTGESGPSKNLIPGIGPSVVDNDGDGDYWEKCEMEAEDHDGFEDEDGCPDPDNDQDGFLDGRDRCPDRSARGSYDGCPDDAFAIEADLDGDGRASGDLCPGAAEDADGFEDDDGCPDADDDGDGLIDPLDACPRAAGPGNGCP